MIVTAIPVTINFNTLRKGRGWQNREGSFFKKKVMTYLSQFIFL